MTTRADARTAARHALPPTDYCMFGIMDELNCYFDSPAEPNNVHVEIWLPGHLDPDRLRDAVTAMLADQPRAGARRADRSWWRRGYAWEFPPQADLDPVSTARWQTEADLDLARARFLATAPPLDRSPPFRLLLAHGPGRDSLILNAHHAAFDGRSCLRLLRLIADRYGVGLPTEPDRTDRFRALAGPGGRPQSPGKQSSGTGPASSQLPGNHSPVRGFRSPVRRFWSPVRRSRSPVRRSRSPVRRSRSPVRRTVRIASRHASGRRPRRAPGYGFALLGWPGVPAAPQPENEPRVTVNDLLIAALIRAITRWNASAHRRPGRVRISMPVDARPPGRDDELGNLSRLCTVAADPLSTAALTAVVAGQTRRAKLQPGPPVSPAQAAVAKMPLPTSAKRRVMRLAVRCLGRLECDTSLLSNLGNITDALRFGVLSPARMWFSTSAHMPRGLSVGAITVDGRLQLCFRYRNALFDAAAAHDFATEYAAALATLAGTEVGP
jgi:NRPS condensation-like uncharacterized protein